MYRQAGGKGGFLSSAIPTPSNIRANLETVKSMMNQSGPHSRTLQRYTNSNAKDLLAARKAGGTPAMIGAAMHGSVNQMRGARQELG